MGHPEIEMPNPLASVEDRMKRLNQRIAELERTRVTARTEDEKRQWQQEYAAAQTEVVDLDKLIKKR